MANSSRVLRLYQRFVDLPFPRLGYHMGNFPLYDGMVAGSANSYLTGATVQMTGVEPPDDESLSAIQLLRQKTELTPEERYFLEYFEAVEELRLALKQELDVADTST